jgi:hypothetical protein
VIVKIFQEAMGKIATPLALFASLLALIASIGSPFFYFGKLEDRIETLERQVHTLTVAPFIANSAEKTPSANPVARACADFARKLADANPVDVVGPNVEQIRSAMADLGCSAPKE